MAKDKTEELLGTIPLIQCLTELLRISDEGELQQVTKEKLIDLINTIEIK